MSNKTPDESTVLAKAPNKMAELKDYLASHRQGIVDVAPKFLTPERVMKLATAAASRSPDLLACTPRSILCCLIDSATLGLEPMTPLQHSFLIPFRHTDKKGRVTYECTLIIGYKGLVTLAHNSGDIESIATDIIYDGDEYAVRLGTHRDLVHNPPRFEERKKRGNPIAYYATVKFRSGGGDFVALSTDEVEQHRSYSSAPESPAWMKFYDSMARKTCVRELCRLLPMSTEHRLGAAVAYESQRDNDDREGLAARPSVVWDMLKDADGEATVPQALPDPKTRGESLAATLDASLKKPAGSPVERPTVETGASGQGTIPGAQ